jgi:hypothetical protein
MAVPKHNEKDYSRGVRSRLIFKQRKVKEEATQHVASLNESKSIHYEVLSYKMITNFLRKLTFDF